jgi:arginyl-tRNA synthetase
MIDEATITRGRDAVRFFLISRKADTEFVFDIDLALKQNDENPVYYVQYAHAHLLGAQRTEGALQRRRRTTAGRRPVAADEPAGVR